MSSDAAPNEPKWKPLNPTQRRVLGVLVEKAKTTPEQYPLSLNGLTTGCNQKNNRDPVTNLTVEQVEEALEELREMGAVLEIQGSGRVAKYKHCLYEWLGVEKVELAVMAELLLRGTQTVGELRGRASRMEPIPDLTALRPILQSLKQKKLLMELSPEGRGQVVTHSLYKDRELAELQARAGSLVAAAHAGSAASSEAGLGDERLVPLRAPAHGTQPASPASSPAASRGPTLDMHNELLVEVAELRAEVSRLRSALQELGDKIASLMS